MFEENTESSTQSRSITVQIWGAFVVFSGSFERHSQSNEAFLIVLTSQKQANSQQPLAPRRGIRK